MSKIWLNTLYYILYYIDTSNRLRHIEYISCKPNSSESRRKNGKTIKNIMTDKEMTKPDPIR